MTYYGVEFISTDCRYNFVSTKLFQNLDKAIAHGKYWEKEGDWSGYRIHKFQLQQEHIQD